MSTPRYDWWPYVKGMIRRYPDLCLKEAALHDTAITANISGMPGGGKRTDKTADAALRMLPEVNRRELEAVRAAVNETKTQDSGNLRLELVKLYYWKRSHTLFGAAEDVHVSRSTAKRWNTEFVKLVAKNFGLL